MKLKTFIIAFAAIACGSLRMSAQEMGIFNHLGVAAEIGTAGLGIEMSAPVTPYLAVRAGWTSMPKLKYSGDVDIESSSPSIIDDEVNVEGKLNMSDMKLLVDLYPSKSGSFHFTVGAFFGKEKVVTAYNTEPFLDPSEWGVSGVMLGDYRVTSDAQGNVSADIKVKSFKPYVGIGWGRAVPKKRLGFSFDMGVQFWGKPSVWTTTKDSFGDPTYSKLEKSDVDNEDANKAFDILSKVSVYPYIAFRINTRIF